MSDEVQVRAPRQRVRLAEVAARAGVSSATVSRSLRGVPKVAPGTRQRVLDAARQLSYVTASQASATDSGPRHTVAVIVPFITRWFFATATAGAVDHLRSRGYDVLLYHLGNADVRDDFFHRMPLAGRVDGIMTLSMPLTEEHTLSLRALGMPLVSIGSSIPGSPSVGIDEVGAARAAVDHLLNLRHQRIGLIASRPDDRRFDFLSSFGRRLGFEEALGAAGLEFDDRLVVDGPHGIDGGAVAMSELLSRPQLPTAVLAEFDELAIGALWALRRAGLRVPEDVSVVGIDDHEMAEFVDLTTVAQSVAEQGQVAASLLLQLLGAEEGIPTVEPIRLPIRLILRGTTAPPRRTEPVVPPAG
ncbi:MAG: LacI family DNA-binding transcriptional regulator [Propionibacteriaceae bacterium]